MLIQTSQGMVDLGINCCPHSKINHILTEVLMEGTAGQEQLRNPGTELVRPLGYGDWVKVPGHGLFWILPRTSPQCIFTPVLDPLDPR